MHWMRSIAEMERSEKRTNRLENRSIESIQSEQQKKKLEKKLNRDLGTYGILPKF